LSIKLEELNKRKYPTTPMIDQNLNELCRRLNKIRAAYGKPMIITSGLRSEGQQAELIKAGKSNATRSKHLTGHAADILDKDGSLGKWALENIKIFEEVGIWIENPEKTFGWLHCQSCPPASGRRIFNP